MSSNLHVTNACIITFPPPSTCVSCTDGAPQCLWQFSASTTILSPSGAPTEARLTWSLLPGWGVLLGVGDGGPGGPNCACSSGSMPARMALGWLPQQLIRKPGPARTVVARGRYRIKRSILAKPPVAHAAIPRGSATPREWGRGPNRTAGIG